MRRLMKRLGLLVWLSLSSLVLATTYQTLSLEDIIGKTELAFYGEVTAVEVEARDGEPWTVVSFTVTEALAGTEAVLEEDETALELAFYGGTLPSGQSLNVSLMPRFVIGENVLVLAYNRTLYSPIVGFRQGLWRDRELGLRSETGQFLTVDDEGALSQGEEGAGTEAILEALRTALEDRE